jgi:phosphoglycerate dehydrogenase-like enzyme
VGPDEAPGWMKEAITAGGGHIVALAEAEALVWTEPRHADRLEEVLDENEHITWVQLPFAGIEPFVHLVSDDRTWTCGKGIYAEPVAELALCLALAGMRGLGVYARATTWMGESGRNLIGSNVTILGGGGITEALLRMLKPFDCYTTVVRNRIEEMENADVVLAADRYVDALAGADLVVLALPLTAETEEMISLTELEMMERHAWLVNVARGKHIVTDDLVWALQNGVIGGAALDVTHPEPLPDDHPLWTLPNCIITPHVAATLEMGDPLLAERITTNVRLFAQDRSLHGLVYPDLGY